MGTRQPDQAFTVAVDLPSLPSGGCVPANPLAGGLGEMPGPHMNCSAQPVRFRALAGELPGGRVLSELNKQAVTVASTRHLARRQTVLITPQYFDARHAREGSPAACDFEREAMS